VRRGGINKIGPWGGPFPSGHRKKVKYNGLVHPEMHEFYVKTNPRQKSVDAVACASVAPMPLHCLICHAGINTWLIIAQQRRNGGGGSYYIISIWAQLADFSQDTLFWGLFLKARKTPKKYFLKATARPQIHLWQKVMRNQNYIVGFYQCHP
jgi:hypothetical protein